MAKKSELFVTLVEPFEEFLEFRGLNENVKKMEMWRF